MYFSFHLNLALMDQMLSQNSTFLCAWLVEFQRSWGRNCFLWEKERV